ncbi:MAG: Fe-S cluster assembly protein SufD [Bacteroidales bacterium]|nr:Fe-S cluster assembly protein SufD [Bacteroidales bacterium]
MIRKDKQPNVWGDQWRPEGAVDHIVLAAGERACVVLCNDSDAPMFMLGTNSSDYRLMPDANRLDINLADGSELELYRLQGVNTPAQHLTETVIVMQTHAQLKMTTITLGGTHVRNNVEVRMYGQECRLQADGLYLIDREQQCDNYIFVEHAQPRCYSRELYKGIIDDSARARFNGHVLVQDGAVKTEAYQTNRNILLTNKAHVDTRPFLEIYNDDVKCSHGSTIGQLDDQAMFYLRSRGISERTAMTMLSYAFCDEVIRSIDLPVLRDAVGDMVKKRLHGELSPSCDDCAIKCTTPCNVEAANFNIDPSKL